MKFTSGLDESGDSILKKSSSADTFRSLGINLCNFSSFDEGNLGAFSTSSSHSANADRERSEVFTARYIAAGFRVRLSSLTIERLNELSQGRSAPRNLYCSFAERKANSIGITASRSGFRMSIQGYCSRKGVIYSTTS